MRPERRGVWSGDGSRGEGEGFDLKNQSGGE